MTVLRERRAGKWPAAGHVTHLMTGKKVKEYSRNTQERYGRNNPVITASGNRIRVVAVRPQETLAKGRDHPGREWPSQPGSTGPPAGLLIPGPSPQCYAAAGTGAAPGGAGTRCSAWAWNVQHISWESREGSGARTAGQLKEKGTGGNELRTPSGGEGLTQRGYQGKGLQHHIAVQKPLSLIKEPPLLLGEVNGHVLKGHTALP